MKDQFWILSVVDVVQNLAPYFPSSTVGKYVETLVMVHQPSLIGLIGLQSAV